jgi:asparagine synthase (glutamine-hydrolysing)
MCGITGFIEKSKVSGEVILQNMTNALQHRGPDGMGTILFDGLVTSIGFGHRRLSIIDLQESAGQPMHFQDLSIVFNGEIYNYREIREELEKLGRTFKTNSDTEVVLQAFDEWGTSSVERFLGMFAFALLNKQQQKIWFFRDRAGVKPFYYYSDGEVFLFGSELKVFHHYPGFNKEIDLQSASQFIQYGYILAPATIFKQTWKLKPGHFIEFSLESFSFKEIEYWTISDSFNKPKLRIGEEEAIFETKKILTSACNYRMVADVPVGVFLSGGYDSSTITAILQHERTEKLKTFSIGFEEAEFNEAGYARNVADYLDTDHTEYYCTVADARKLIHEIPEYWDEPFADASAIPTLLVSKLAREKVTVALSADAGDELFGGYTKYTSLLSIDAKLGAIPSGLRKTVASVLKQISPDQIPIFNKTYNYQTRYYKGISLLETVGIENGLQSIASFFSNQEIRELFQIPIHSSDFLKNIQLLGEDKDTISRMLNIDYQTYMVDDVLVKVDRATMSVGLEGREPLLDHRLSEWAAQLPSELKIRNGQKKYILKQICHQYLPKEMMDRPKMGFGIPMVKWFEAEIESLVLKYLEKDFVKRQGIFHYEVIEQIVIAYRKNRNANVYKLWNLLMFQLWYERWMG